MTNIEKALGAVLHAVVEPQFKDSPCWKSYLKNRFQNRVFILMELMKHKGLVDHDYWNFYAISDENRLHSDFLMKFGDFCQSNLFGNTDNLTPEAAEIVRELDSLTGTCSVVTNVTGVDVPLSNACLLLYRMSKYGFADDSYTLSATKKSILNNDIQVIEEILLLTRMFIRHPAFSHLANNYKLFAKNFSDDLYLRAEKLRKLAKTSENIAKTVEMFCL